MKQFFKSLPSLLKETAAEWQSDNAMRLAAALAYYTVFSLAPLLLAAISIAGLVWGAEAASGRIHAQLSTAVGSSVATAVQEMVTAASKPATGVISTILAFALALFGASGVFGELMGSLNQIWGAKAKTGGGLMTWIRGRFLSIGMVMGVCFLLMVSMITSAVLTQLGSYGLQHLPGLPLLLQSLHQLLSLAVITTLFSAMFKYLPATPIQWRDVWVGGAVTAVLFSLGKLAMEQYVARAAPTSSFGAASSLALLLVWVYYSAQIFLFGAEFTEVYARRRGSRSLRPAPRHLPPQNAAAAAFPNSPTGDLSLATAPPDASRRPHPGHPDLLPALLTAVAMVGIAWLRRRPGRR